MDDFDPEQRTCTDRRCAIEGDHSLLMHLQISYMEAEGVTFPYPIQADEVRRFLGSL